MIVNQSPDPERWNKSVYTLVKGRIALGDDGGPKPPDEQGETPAAPQASVPPIGV
jgi:hypothetical protein